MKKHMLLFWLITGAALGMEDLSLDGSLGAPPPSPDQSGIGGDLVEGDALEVVQQKLQAVVQKAQDPLKDSEESEQSSQEPGPLSLKSVPVSIFKQPRGYIEGAKVAVGYYGQKALNVTGNVLTTMASLSPSGVVKKLGESAGEVSKSMTTEESPQFPNLSVKYIYSVFEGIRDRKVFSGRGLFERCILFEKGSYLGAAIIVDYNVGEDRFFEPGNLTKEFYSVDDTTRVEEAIEPGQWLNSQYNMESCTLNAMMVGSRYKDGLYNSHLLYKLGGDPVALYLDVMRKPATEFVEKVTGWIFEQNTHQSELGEAFVAWIREQTGITPERQEELCKRYTEVWVKLREEKVN